MIHIATQGLHLSPLVAKLFRLSGDPSNVVLLETLDEVYAFQHICDVVDAPFLHAEDLHGFVQVKAVVFGVDQALDELLRQLNEAVLFATSFAAILVKEALVLQFHLPTRHYLVAASQRTCLAAQEGMATLCALGCRARSATSTTVCDSFFELPLLVSCAVSTACLALVLGGARQGSSSAEHAAALHILALGGVLPVLGGPKLRLE